MPRLWQIHIRCEEVHGHGDLRPVGQHEVGAVPQLLDEAEDVIPTTAVQAGGVVAELPEDLVHFERPENRFNQDGGTDGTLRDATVILGKHENVIPKAGFQVGLQLR